MPPAESICIIKDVPERGSPDTIVITISRYLPEAKFRSSRILFDAPSADKLSVICLLTTFFLQACDNSFLVLG